MDSKWPPPAKNKNIPRVCVAVWSKKKIFCNRVHTICTYTDIFRNQIRAVLKKTMIFFDKYQILWIFANGKKNVQFLINCKIKTRKNVFQFFLIKQTYKENNFSEVMIMFSIRKYEIKTKIEDILIF